MRTVIIIILGMALWFLVTRIARKAGVSPQKATLGFAALWFVAAGVNLWIGVAQAGYSFMEELPIFALIFALPVVLGWLLAGRLSGK